MPIFRTKRKKKLKKRVQIKEYIPSSLKNIYETVHEQKQADFNYLRDISF